MMRSAALSALIGGVACAAILLGGEYLIGEIFGGEYVGAYIVTAILLLGTFVNVVTFPVTPMLYALHRTEVPLFAKALGIGTSLATLYPLSQWLGLAGAALATLLGTLIAIFSSVAVLGREYRVARTA